MALEGYTDDVLAPPATGSLVIEEYDSVLIPATRGAE